MARLIRECLQKDVDDRPANAVECLALLEGAQAELQQGPQVQPDARDAAPLHVEHAGRPPRLGEVVPVAVSDGWIIPEQKS